MMEVVNWRQPSQRSYAGHRIRRGRKPAVSLLGLAFVLILAGEMIGRGVFYGLHMTVGMAVAS